MNFWEKISLKKLIFFIFWEKSRIYLHQMVLEPKKNSEKIRKNLEKKLEIWIGVTLNLAFIQVFKLTPIF